MRRVWRARVDGPLAAHAEGFRGELARLGYTPGSAELQMQLVGRVSSWLESERLSADGLTAVAVDRMVMSWRAAAASGRRVASARSLVALLGYLRAKGVLAVEPPAASSPLDELLAAYRAHLICDRGLQERTIGRYEVTARRFLERRRLERGGETGAEELTGGEVTRFLLAECSRVSVGSAKGRVAELRSLLRFLHLRGVTIGGLAGSVPPVAGWRDQRLVATLSGAEVAAILGSCQYLDSDGRSRSRRAVGVGAPGATGGGGRRPAVG